MLKQIIILVALSAAIVFSMSYAQQLVQLLVHSHAYAVKLLSNLFSEGQAGSLARGLLGLLCVPVLAGLIPAVVYYMARRHWFPYFMQIVWVVWLLQAGALITQAS